MVFPAVSMISPRTMTTQRQSESKNLTLDISYSRVGCKIATTKAYTSLNYITWSGEATGLQILPKTFRGLEFIPSKFV